MQRIKDWVNSMKAVVMNCIGAACWLRRSKVERLLVLLYPLLPIARC